MDAEFINGFVYLGYKIPEDIFLVFGEVAKCLKDDKGTVICKDAKVYQYIKNFFLNEKRIVYKKYWEYDKSLLEALYYLKKNNILKEEITDNIIESCKNEIMKAVSFPIVSCNNQPTLYCFKNKNLETAFNKVFSYIKKEYAQEVFGFCQICSISFNKIYNGSTVLDFIISLRAKNKEKQYTYLMKDASGFYKIGVSKDVTKRENTIRVGNASIETICKTEGNIEKMLHLKYADRHIRGEWFNLTKEQVKEIKTIFNTTDNGK